MALVSIKCDFCNLRMLVGDNNKRVEFTTTGVRKLPSQDYLCGRKECKRKRGFKYA